MTCDVCGRPIPPLGEHRLPARALLGSAQVRMDIDAHVHADCCPGGCDLPHEHMAVAG